MALIAHGSYCPCSSNKTVLFTHSPHWPRSSMHMGVFAHRPIRPLASLPMDLIAHGSLCPKDGGLELWAIRLMGVWVWYQIKML